MTINDAFSSDLIDLPADPITALAKHTRKNVIAVVLTVIAGALFIVGGPTAVGIGGCLVVFAIVALRQHYYAATFDLARRQVTVKRITLLSTRQRTLPFDAIQWLDFEPGERGAALWLKDGSMLKVAAAPDNYAKLDCRLSDIRTRTGLPAARVSPRHADVYSGVFSDPTGQVTITSSNRDAIPRVIGGLAILLMTAIAVAGVILMSLTEPAPKNFSEWFGFFLALAGLLLWLLIGSFGVFMLFGQPTKLLIEPATRQLHIEGGFVRPRREKSIAFEDIASAGVIHESDRHGSRFTPYVELRSHRVIRLSGLGGDFRRSDQVADLVRQMTGASQKNIG
jgi:hypothetical protein